MSTSEDAILPRRTVAVDDRVVGGRYVVRAVLGNGGAGQVFAVENETIGRRFALKILRCNLVTDDQVKRFHREARALGRVSSPHVAQVIDFAVDPLIGPYLVMELLDGETLGQRLARQQRLAVEEVVTLATELCQALDEIHRVGIVHRDLKPSNIGLPRDGAVRIKLLDFGIAASIDGAFTEQLTQSQQFLGTMPYMAPELFRGMAPSPSFDLYALGVVLFQLLTGKTPYVATTPAVYIQQHLFAAIPRIEDAAPDVQVPAWLDDLVTNLLAKEPAERLPSAVAVAEVLRAGRAGRAVRVDGSRRRTTRRWVIGLTAGALVVGGVMTWASSSRRPAPAVASPAAPATPALPSPVAIPALPSPTPAPALPSPTPAPALPNATPAIAPSPSPPTAKPPAEPRERAADPLTRRRPARQSHDGRHDKARPWHGEILEDD